MENIFDVLYLEAVIEADKAMHEFYIAFDKTAVNVMTADGYFSEAEKVGLLERAKATCKKIAESIKKYTVKMLTSVKERVKGLLEKVKPLKTFTESKEKVKIVKFEALVPVFSSLTSEFVRISRDVVKKDKADTKVNFAKDREAVTDAIQKFNDDIREKTVEVDMLIKDAIEYMQNDFVKLDKEFQNIGNEAIEIISALVPDQLAVSPDCMSILVGMTNSIHGAYIKIVSKRTSVVDLNIKAFDSQWKKSGKIIKAAAKAVTGTAILAGGIAIASKKADKMVDVAKDTERKMTERQMAEQQEKIEKETAEIEKRNAEMSARMAERRKEFYASSKKFDEAIAEEQKKMNDMIASSVRNANRAGDSEFKARHDQMLRDMHARHEEDVKKLFGDRGLERYKNK